MIFSLLVPKGLIDRDIVELHKFRLCNKCKKNRLPFTLVLQVVATSGGEILILQCNDLPNVLIVVRYPVGQFACRYGTK